MKSKDSNFKKSVSYQKKDGHVWLRPSFFWYDNDKDLKVCLLMPHLLYVCIYALYHVLLEFEGCTF